MPPKQKFSKEEIIEMGLKITREQGLNCVTARSLGEHLGSSSRPVFTVFHNMEEVHQAIIDQARKLYNQKIEYALTCEKAFQQVGTEYIHFAVTEPKLFQLLFMTELADTPQMDNVLPILDENNRAILKSVQREYGLNPQKASRFYHELWIFTHGIATLFATRVCKIPEKEIQLMMTDVCRGILQLMK